MDSYYSDRPLNFAHRGASYEAPENTLAAFMLAAELGADGIELDVQLSKDGQVAVIHDFTLETTTNGHGPVGAKTLAELQELDAGSRFDPLFAGQQIPTLQEVIDVWRLIARAGKVQIIETYPAQIDLYSDTPIDGALAAFVRVLMQKVVAAGVRVDFLAIIFSSTNAFGFDPDDPNVNGFGDYNDAQVGGELAYIQLTQ